MLVPKWLLDSERTWKLKHRYRQAQLTRWRRILTDRRERLRQRPGDDRMELLVEQAEDAIDKWEGSRDEASYWLRRRRGEIAAARAKLSENFDVAEFDCNDGTKVPAVAIPALRRLCADVLEPLRDRYGAATVTSGYRHRKYNEAIGGEAQSQHIYDLTPGSVAADVKFARGTPAQWATSARKLDVGGVGEYRRAGFVHVDNGPRRDWWG